MKKLLLLIIIILAFTAAFYHRSFLKFIAYNFVYKYEVLEQPITGYPKKASYSFVQETDDFYPDSKQDILNIIYTSINNGWNDFTFICDYEYDKCESDMKDIASDVDTLSMINNYVHPYNSYDRLHIIINGLGKIKIEVVPLYEDYMINELNAWVDNVINTKIKPTMSTSTKLATIYNYIISKTVYDKERADAIKRGISMPNNFSHIAYGILSDGKTVCGGYTDMMALFLEKLHIPNFKISTESHVWNFVYYGNEWRHMDLTWDDPYPTNNVSNYKNLFFLIDTEELLRLDVEQHNFDLTIVKEAQ